MAVRLVMSTGLPGIGKSVLAEYAARFLECPWLSKDILEAALWRSSIGSDLNSGWAAYEFMTTLAECQLRLERSVVLDSVATHERIRTTWREMAVTYGASFTVIECVCSDERLHRTRHSRRVIHGKLVFAYKSDYPQSRCRPLCAALSLPYERSLAATSTSTTVSSA